jgi:hypothetical protein
MNEPSQAGGQDLTGSLINVELLAGRSSLWQLTRQIAGLTKPITIATGGLNDLRIYDSLKREHLSPDNASYARIEMA